MNPRYLLPDQAVKPGSAFKLRTYNTLYVQIFEVALRTLTDLALACLERHSPFWCVS